MCRLGIGEAIFNTKDNFQTESCAEDCDVNIENAISQGEGHNPECPFSEVKSFATSFDIYFNLDKINSSKINH